MLERIELLPISDPTPLSIPTWRERLVNTLVNTKDRLINTVRQATRSPLVRGIVSGVSRIGLVSGVIIVTPPAADALDAYLVSRRSGLVRFINPLTTSTVHAQAEEETLEAEAEIQPEEDTDGTELVVIQPADIGGEVTETAPETVQPPSELFNTTPQGRLVTEKFKEGEVGWKPRQESADKTDGFLNELNVKVIFILNPNLRSWIGTHTLKPCDNCNKTSERYGVLEGRVDPTDPRTLIMESNFFRRDFKLDPADRERLSAEAAGATGKELSKIIYGKPIDDLTQEQKNYIGQLAVKLEYEIRPLELIAPISG